MELKLDLGKWELIFGLLVVNYETYCDLVFNAPLDDVNLEDYKRELLSSQEAMETIMRQVEKTGLKVESIQYDFGEVR